MKVVACVLALCLAGSLGGVLLPVGVSQTAGVGSQVQDASQLANQLRDVSQNQAAGQAAVAAKKGFGQSNQIQEDKANQANSANQAAANSYGQKAANQDQAFSDVANAASKASSAAVSQDASRSNAASKATAQDASSNTVRNFRNNNVRKDGINYAYDKKYDLNDNKNGAYIFQADDSAHALDHNYDRSSAYDRNVDNYAAAAQAADQQAANRRAQANQNQAAAQAARDAFGRNADNAAQNAGQQSAYSNKVDTGNQANSDNSFVARKAQDVFQDNLLQNTDQKRFGQQFGAGGNQLGGLSSYNGGGLSFPDFGKNFGAVDAAHSNNQGSNARFANQGLLGTQDLNKAAFAKDQWLNDDRAAASNNLGNWFSDQGFSDRANNAQQAANALNADAADAQSAKNNAKTQSNLNEDAKFADQEKKALSDRNKNNRVYQNYYNNDNVNSNNAERLNYDKNQVDDQIGYDNTVRQDSAHSADQAAENGAQASNARQAENANANDAASRRQAQDWNTADQGYQNQQAAANDAAQAARQGLNNNAWKVDSADQRGNNAYNNQNLWEQGSQGYNNGASLYGGNFGLFGNRGPGSYGGGYGGYPYSGSGYNFGGRSPGYNFY